MKRGRKIKASKRSERERLSVLGLTLTLAPWTVFLLDHVCVTGENRGHSSDPEDTHEETQRSSPGPGITPAQGRWLCVCKGVRLHCGNMINISGKVVCHTWE